MLTIIRPQVKAGDYVETYGRELAFDELEGRIGQLIVISKDTESGEWRQVVRVADIIWNSFEGCRRFIYSDGSRHKFMVDERYFRSANRYRIRTWEV